MRYFIALSLCFSLMFFYYKTHSVPAPSAKIYDCFIFYNELELLDIRLHELADKVDGFVLVESVETFRGKPKPLFFEENKHLFDKFKDKITHVVVRDRIETDNPWEREYFQRNQIVRGLKKCLPQDIILISDVDEIISQNAIDSIKTAFAKEKVEAVVCEQQMYLGYLNRCLGPWRGSVAVRCAKVKQHAPNSIRRLRTLKSNRLYKARVKKWKLLPQAGWHFCSMGGVQKFIAKLESFSHAECDTQEAKNPAQILRQIRSYPVVAIDESFPRYVRQQRLHFEQLGFFDYE